MRNQHLRRINNEFFDIINKKNGKFKQNSFFPDKNYLFDTLHAFCYILNIESKERFQDFEYLAKEIGTARIEAAGSNNSAGDAIFAGVLEYFEKFG